MTSSFKARGLWGFLRRRLPVSRCLPGLASILLLSLAGRGLSGCGVQIGSGPPGFAVVQVKDLGPIATNPDILGRDGGYSALFQGYSVWLYGDTFLGDPNAEGFSLISDSWSYTKDLDASSGIAGFQERLDSAGAPTMILSLTSVEETFNAAHNGSNCQQPCGARWALWPSSIVVDPASDNALIFYGLVSAAPGNFNFSQLGNSVARWQNFQGQPQRPSISPVVVSGHPDLLFGQNEPNFGSASLMSGGMLYVYGCGTPASTDKGCRLGKVNPANVADRSAWTYDAGGGKWSPQIADAIAVFTGDNILSVAWNSYLQQYVAVYSAVFSQNVIMRSSPSPEGPWSREVIAFAAMQPASGNVYDALAHPEYDANGGQTIYVSYSRSTNTLFSSEVRLVAVQLGRASAGSK